MRRPSRLLFAAAAATLALSACGQDEPVELEDAADAPVEEPAEEPEATDPAPPADEPADDEADDADDDADEPAADDTDDVPEPDDADDDDDGDDAPDDGDTATDDDTASGPQPDAALVSAPCAPHDTRTMENFIEVAAPVADQQVGDSIELVGCSNVFEANVQWALQDDDGTELASGFTTAECGNGCVGAFTEELDLTAGAGEDDLVLVVFADDPSGGTGTVEPPVVEIELERG